VAVLHVPDMPEKEAYDGAFAGTADQLGYPSAKGRKILTACRFLVFLLIGIIAVLWIVIRSLVSK
jgi:hypothetical protein